MAGAKDDRLDAFVLADALRSDRHKLRRISLDDPLIIQLRELTRLRADCDEIDRQANRLRDQLFRYFPQPLTLCPGADEPWLWALLELAPTAGRAAQLRHSRIERLLQQHRIRRFTADQLREKLREPALKVAAGVVEAASTHIAVLLPMLRLANEQRQRVERRIAGLLEQMTAPNKDDTGQHSDAAVLLSLPGVGRVVAATMLAEAWQALAERDGARLRAEMGVAPITKRSGKTMLHLMRRACNQRLRQAAYFWSANAMANDQEDPSQICGEASSRTRACAGIAVVGRWANTYSDGDATRGHAL